MTGMSLIEVHLLSGTVAEAGLLTTGASTPAKRVRSVNGSWTYPPIRPMVSADTNPFSPCWS